MKQKKVLYLESKYNPPGIYSMVKAITQKYSYQLSIMNSNSKYAEFENILNLLSETYLVIADISDESNDVVVGQTIALKIPILFISSSKNDLNIKYSKYLVWIYSLKSNETDYDEFMEIFSYTVEQIDSKKEKVIFERDKKSRLFISYSHKDKEYLDRLLVHLKPLEKHKLIDVWVDTRLKTGDLWKKEIEQAMENAEVCILLISADYLASDFIVDNELPPILESAQKKGTRIISLILKPCRFTRDKNLNIFQASNDPKFPMCALPEIEQEKKYDEIANEVERLLKADV